MNDCGYPYTFVGIDTTKSDAYQIDTLVYRFESAKSGHQYEVHVERYNVYAEKDSIIGRSRHDDCNERNGAKNRSGGCRG